MLELWITYVDGEVLPLYISVTENIGKERIIEHIQRWFEDVWTDPDILKIETGKGMIIYDQD